MGLLNKYKFIITLAICAVLLLLLTRSCGDNSVLKKEIKKEKERSEQNIHALTDSITIYKNKGGEVSYGKIIANMSKDELKELNPTLYDIIKKEGGNIRTVIVTRLVYVDSGKVKNVVFDRGNGTYALNFDYVSSDSVVSIVGKSIFSATVDSTGVNYKVKVEQGETIFDSTKVSIGLTTGIKKEGGVDRIFVTPTSPNVKITKLDGTDVSDYFKNQPVPQQRRKNFSINTSVGYGIMFGSDGNVTHGPCIQIGIGYNIINF